MKSMSMSLSNISLNGLTGGQAYNSQAVARSGSWSRAKYVGVEIDFLLLNKFYMFNLIFNPCLTKGVPPPWEFFPATAKPKRKWLKPSRLSTSFAVILRTKKKIGGTPFRWGKVSHQRWRVQGEWLPF